MNIGDVANGNAADPHIDEIDAKDLLGDYPALRYYPPSGDLIFRCDDALGRRRHLRSHGSRDQGIRVSVATPKALYQLKKSTVRPLDHRDAQALRGILASMEKNDLGVQKFRSVEEMEAEPVIVRANDGFERFLRHCARYWMLSPRKFPRGVFKFRSIEEAGEARDKVNVT